MDASQASDIDKQIHLLLERGGEPLHYTSDLNAVADALPDDFDLLIRRDPQPEAEINRGYLALICSPAGNCRSWDGVTRQEAAAKALLAFLQWKQSQEGV